MGEYFISSHRAARAGKRSLNRQGNVPGLARAIASRHNCSRMSGQLKGSPPLLQPEDTLRESADKSICSGIMPFPADLPPANSVARMRFLF